MTQTVTSADGTRIAYDVIGAGAPLVLIGGALCGREGMLPYAEALAGGFAVVNYDRRGRGASADTAPYAVRREIEDLAALIAAVGGEAAVYGHSSGAALALHAAAAGLPIDRLVLHEPPFSDDEPDGEVAALIADGRLGDAVAAHLARTGMPAEVVDGMRSGPWWGWMEANAATIPYDYEVLSARGRGGRAPVEQARDVRVPTLVLAGGESAAWMIEAGRLVAAAIPDGRQRIVSGHGHVVPPEILAPIVADFLSPLSRAVAGVPTPT
ncbi:alpha/beta fold hydrolase [Fodinicola acaciae]|uniref:alpha/beta fold hydrolase n=1 Tax=Fodinicola acaciae TaxID=2681555 RepID=UPI0013D867DE|nr:alpha/beta hydrolase [Fodinicola acaciae]